MKVKAWNTVSTLRSWFGLRRGRNFAQVWVQCHCRRRVSSFYMSSLTRPRTPQSRSVKKSKTSRVSKKHCSPKTYRQTRHFSGILLQHRERPSPQQRATIRTDERFTHRQPYARTNERYTQAPPQQDHGSRHAAQQSCVPTTHDDVIRDQVGALGKRHSSIIHYPSCPHL